MSAKPTVDDQFWFDQSKDSLVQATARRNEAAAKLTTTVGWLWGIYFASVSVGVSFQQKFDFPTDVLIVLVLPVPLLLLAYWCSTWAQMPPLLWFDPRSPTEIREAFGRGTKSRSLRLNLALMFSLFASLTVAAALVVGSSARSIALPSIKAVVLRDPRDIRSATLTATGRFPPDTVVRFRCIPLSATDTKSAVTEAGGDPRRISAAETGNVAVSLPLPTPVDAAGYEVLVDWEQSGTTRSMGIVAKTPGTQPPGASSGK